jgi:hypothetical protein
MSGIFVEFTTSDLSNFGPNQKYSIAAGYTRKSKAIALAIGNVSNGVWKRSLVKKWSDDASPTLAGPKKNPAMESIAFYKKASGCLMLVQTMRVPDTMKDTLQLHKAYGHKKGERLRLKHKVKVDNKMWWSCVDGGCNSPAIASASISSQEPAHRTYPFFKWDSAHYKIRAPNASYHASDYASSAVKHTEIVFECALVTRFTSTNDFGMIAGFKWGLASDHSIFLSKLNINSMPTSFLATVSNDYPDVNLIPLTSTNKHRIDSSYTPY